MCWALCLLRHATARGLLLLCLNPARAAWLPLRKAFGARRCKVQRMGLAAHYARLMGASSRTWVGIHLHACRLAEARNQSDVMRRRDYHWKRHVPFLRSFFYSLREKTFFLKSKIGKKNNNTKIWMGQVFMNGCSEEREHTRRVSLMRLGEAASASLSSERRGSRWQRPLTPKAAMNEWMNKQTNKQTNKKKTAHADACTHRHTEMLILWLWRHRLGCITQVAVRLFQACSSLKIHPFILPVWDLQTYQCCEWTHLPLNISQCALPWHPTFCQKIALVTIEVRMFKLHMMPKTHPLLWLCPSGAQLIAMLQLFSCCYHRICPFIFQ